MYYDLFDYLQQSEIQNREQNLKNVVMYNDFTPFFLSKLKIEKSYGISIFVHLNDTLITEYQKNGLVHGYRTYVKEVKHFCV